MIIVPERYSYIEVYLTLACNFQCQYCINKHTGVNRKRQELSTREWILGINNIQPGKLPITFGGGEPTIRKDFYEIVNGLHEDISIDLLTNGYFDESELINSIPVTRFKPNTAGTLPSDSMYKSIRISYHPKSSDVDSVIRKAAVLDDAGYSVGIFGLNHPENLRSNIAMSERCHKIGVYFFIRDFLGYYRDLLYGYYKYPGALNGNLKSCQCRTQELLIDPSGDIHRCHKCLYDGTECIGNILNLAYEITDEFYPCESYGACNPCDVKLKLAPDLQTSKCSVEINA